MSVEQDIQRLLALAAPLRLLADDDPAKVPLTAIVDDINALRALQSQEKSGAAPVANVEGADVDPEAERIKLELAKVPADLPARRPGRPKKA